MNAKLTIRIKKRTKTGWLLWLFLMLPFLFGLLNDFLGLPWLIRYVLDFAWFALLVYQIRYDKLLNTHGTKVFFLYGFAFLIYTFLVYFVQFQSPLYYLWGVRNNFRFYIVFLSFALFLRTKDADDYFVIFDRIFWVNVFVSLIQFFILGLEGDYLGGIFGTQKGGNAYTNIFFVIIISKSVLSYLEKKEFAKNCVLKCVAALLVAALAELKFFFVEFVVIVALASMFTNFSWRKFGVIIGAVFAVLFGAYFLTVIFPEFVGFLSWEWLMEAASSDKGYTSSGDINRLNAISVINDRWLNTCSERILGFGLGNCETSTFTFLNTPFYESYGDMHYTWLSYAFIYLECGWIGLSFYFGFFVLVYFRAHEIEKRSSGNAVTYCRLARIMAILCMIISVYNSSLRTEAGYIAYFVLAIPFVFDRQARIDETRRKEVAI